MGQGGLMSAVNSDSSDRDREAIESARRAHEPSMEEILASIRNIIAEDPARGASPKPLQPAPAPITQIVYAKGAAAAQGEPSEADAAARRITVGGNTAEVYEFASAGANA